MTKVKLADRIKQLNDISHTLLKYAEKIRDLHDNYLPKTEIEKQYYKTSEIPMSLRFLQCTFFFDALLNLSTILSPLQKDLNKKEQSLFELVELESNQNIKDNLLLYVNKIRKQFENKNLHKWRNKYVAHKDIKNAGDTEIMYLNFIKKDIINESIIISKEIHQFLMSNYTFLNTSNTFMSLNSKSVDKMLELFENELRDK